MLAQGEKARRAVRKIIWLILGLAAAGLLSCAAQKKKTVVVDPSKPTAGVEQPAEKDGDIECRWIIPTGSSLRKKVCKSRFEWEAEKQSAKDFLQRPRARPNFGQ